MNGKFLPENETVEFEERLYLDPNTSLQEQTDFISNLRNIQNANNAEINAQTYNLGTAVPSNLGGLVGGEGYFTSRYQTPQNVSVAANLRATAQAQALNDVLQNETNMWKQRYNEAYKAAQKRASTSAPSISPTNPTVELPIDTNNDGETIELDVYEPKAGQIIPNTDYVSDYQDASTGKWYQLTSPREIDLMTITTGLGGNKPSDGEVRTANGRTFRYVAATDSWYEQTNSVGPNTYSPRSR